MSADLHILEARGVFVEFGGIHAISDLNLAIRQGDIFGLIGPNGAGKSTTVNVLTGFQRPSRGKVLLNGRDIAVMPPEMVARRGIARSFQAARVFPKMTSEEAVATAILSRVRSVTAALTEARDLLCAMGYESLLGQKGAALNYGDQRRLGLARALALRPRFLLMDEPAAGMNAAEAADLVTLIRSIPQDHGCAVLLIEHNTQVVTDSCTRVLVLDGGRTIAEGTPRHVMSDATVRRAYLGD